MIDVPVEVKDALREGTYKKNYRFVVLNEDGTPDEEIGTIDNDYLVSETVSIDERMCSGDKLKFGLCEGSSIEFQYFNKPNITGKRVQVFVDVEYEKPVTQYAWETQGFFNDYYDITGMSGECRVFNPEPNAWAFMWVDEDGQSTRVYAESSEDGTVVPLGDVTGRTLLVSKPVIPEHHLGYVQLLVPHEVPTIFTHTIPMGYFDIKKCSRQASTGIIKATGFNKLQSDYLDANANLLLLESYGSNNENILVYDIQKMLLEDYQIKADYEDVVPKEGLSFGVAVLVLTGVPFYFTSLYGLETPLSACEYNDIEEPSLTRPFYIEMNFAGLEFNITQDSYWSFYKHFGDLEVFERNIYNRLKYIFDSAVLRTTSRIAPFNNGIVTGEMFCDWICKNTTRGFAYIFGAQIIQNGVTKTYSTIQWEYEEANNLTHTVVGTINDFVNITRRGQATIRLQLPNQLTGNMDTSLNPGRFSIVQFGNTGSFKWWTNVDMSLIKSFWLDPIQYANGVDYEADSLTNNFDEAVTCGTTVLSDANSVAVNPVDLADFTLRDIASANYETLCQFGQLSRTTDLFSGVELNHSRLYPADSLYPATDLYPDGAVVSGFKSMYSKLWADEGNIHKWRNLVITYKGLNGDQQEEDFTLERQVNADGTDDYNMSDNWLFRNLIWTAEQVAEYAEAMVAKMQDMTWFPFEMWCAGLPYLETGDEIEIPLGEETYTSYILQRQLKGIQNLQDTYINGTLDIF